MPWTLKTNRSNAVIGITSSRTQAYLYARDYLRSQWHREATLSEQLAKAQYDWEKSEIEDLLHIIDTEVTAFDAFDRPIFTYWCHNNGTVEKIKEE